MTLLEGDAPITQEIEGFRSSVSEKGAETKSTVMTSHLVVRNEEDRTEAQPSGLMSRLLGLNGTGPPGETVQNMIVELTHPGGKAAGEFLCQVLVMAGQRPSEAGAFRAPSLWAKDGPGRPAEAAGGQGGGQRQDSPLPDSRD